MKPFTTASRYLPAACLAALVSLTPLPLQPATSPHPPAPPLAKMTDEGFNVPQPGREFVFPRDHGSHPDFKIEWWYITGHLFSQPDNRRFGFQATFFRSAAPPPENSSGTNSPLFRLDQLYLAHMALLDVKEKRFIFQERFNRAGWNAEASTNTLSVRNGNWSLQLRDPDSGIMELRGNIRGEAFFELQLTPKKPLVVFGRDGVSRKASDPTAASHYLTFSRLAAEGSLRIGQHPTPVTGQAWMDHEISSSQLSRDQVGWDWASLQLNDQREVMVYQLRLKSGEPDPFSTLAWIDEEGKTTHFGPADFSWEPEDTWTSPTTGAAYPLPVRITCRDPRTGLPAEFRLVPLMKAQELTGELGGVAYWEGACRVIDARGREIGSAFMELTGYAGDLSKSF